MSDSRLAFERDYSEDGKWGQAIERNPDGSYRFMGTSASWLAWDRAWQASRQALEGEAVDVERIADTVRDNLGDIFACTRVWDAWQVGTMTQNDFTPADETDLADEIAESVAALYTHPASRQAVSVPQQWRDTMEELAADLESEIENRRSGDLDRRIKRDLIVVREARALLAEQEQGQ